MGNKKGLLAYDTRYGSTADVAFWVRALIGDGQDLDVKRYGHVITLDPYDYVIIGGFTRWEKPFKTTYDFVERFREDLANKEVAYFLTCGESDETVLMNMPNKPIHLSCGRSYFFDILEKFPEIEPVTTGGFGGRQVKDLLNTQDSAFIWFLEHTMPPDKIGWTGRDYWESLIPERVEFFANEIREKILSLPPVRDVKKYRRYWKSQQPGVVSDSSVGKFSVRPYNNLESTKRSYCARSRFKGNLEEAESLLEQWAKEADVILLEEKKTSFNTYFRGIKTYSGESLSIHIVTALFPEDPGNVHVSFRSYDKPEMRSGAEKDITDAEALLWADGRKVD